MLLDELQPVLLCEQHEPVHGPLRLVLVLAAAAALLLLRRGHGRGHQGLRLGRLRRRGDPRRRGRGRGRRDHRRRRGCEQRRVLLIELEPPEPVAQVGRPHGLGVVRRQADVAHVHLGAGDAVAVDGQAGVNGAPA